MGHFFVDDGDSLSEPDREIDDMVGLLRNYQLASGGIPWRGDQVVTEIAEESSLSVETVEDILGYLEFEGVVSLKTKRSGKKKHIIEVRCRRMKNGS